MSSTELVGKLQNVGRGERAAQRLKDERKQTRTRISRQGRKSQFWSTKKKGLPSRCSSQPDRLCRFDFCTSSTSPLDAVLRHLSSVALSLALAPFEPSDSFGSTPEKGPTNQPSIVAAVHPQKQTAVGPSTMNPDTTATVPKTFRYPPIYAFPPFYTIQHNPVSRGQQLSQWRALILDFCRYHRIFCLSPLPGTSDTSQAAKSEVADPHKSLFSNRAIQRSLSPESIRQVLTDLVDHKQAVWEDSLIGKSRPGAAGSNTNAKAYIYWKTPAQWGDAIYEWVIATGQNKSIMTLFELTQGELVESQGMLIRPLFEVPTMMAEPL